MIEWNGLPARVVYVLSNSSPAVPCSKASNQSTSVGREERYFVQKIQQSGEKVDSCPDTNSEYPSQPWQFLKEKQQAISIDHWEDVRFLIIFPWRADMLNSLIFWINCLAHVVCLQPDSLLSTWATFACSVMSRPTRGSLEIEGQSFCIYSICHSYFNPKEKATG